jgi:transposase-like protein
MRRTRGLTKLAGRSYWREDDARRIVDAWLQSGEPVSVVAAHLGIDPRRVSRWARRLDDRSHRACRFVPVRVADDRPEGRASIDIELGHGRRVRVAAGFAADDLRRVLAILDERMPC